MLPARPLQQFIRLPLLALLLFFVTSIVTSCDSQETIVNGINEKEANEIVVFLAAKGIKATKMTVESGGAGGGGEVLYNITVEAGRATEAMAILTMNGLPRRKGQDLLTLFQQGGLVPSEMEEKIKYEAGLAEQIASTIRKIDGVLDADVQLSFPAEDPLNPGKKTGEVTASVYVKHQGVLDDPNTHLVTKIKRLVASSIIDLEYDNVTVISDRARFSDVAFSQLSGGMDEDREYVRVWSLVLAKESVSRFRVVFFAFIFVFLLMGVSVVWLTWKVFPVVQQSGGVMKLFSLAPLVPGAASTEGAEDDSDADEEAEEEESEEAPADEDEGEEEEDQASKEVT